MQFPDTAAAFCNAGCRKVRFVALLGLAVALTHAVPVARAEGVRDDAVAISNTASEWQQSFDATVTPRELGATDTDYATLSSGTIPAMQEAVDRYAGIVSAGGWPEVPDGPALKLGMRDERVAILRKRLLISGDLEKNSGKAQTYDSFVQLAVRKFQYRHGLRTDGVVRGGTLKAINVSAMERLRQLRTNVVRIHTFQAGLPSRYVMVNIAAAEIEAVDDGIVVSRHTAIVGRADRQTPVLASKVYELNFNPFWHVPQSIVERDIIPRMQEDPGYLQKYIIRVYNQKGEELDPAAIDWHSDEPKKYVYRQDPGEDINSLGAVKINFSNQHAVFLHDTPQKDLFATNDRNYSSGCVRVQNIEQLITWMLRTNDPGYWSREKVDAIIASGERLDVGLKSSIPLFMIYISAWTSPNGPVHFRDDVYERDGPGTTAATY